MPSPTSPAKMLRSIESWPSVGPTERLWMISRGTPSDPALSWITMSSTSSGGIPSMTPCPEIGARIVGDEMTVLSMRIDIGSPRCSLVNVKKRVEASPWSSNATT